MSRQTTFIPTKREIITKAAEIRETWSVEERSKRRSNFKRQKNRIYTRLVKVFLTSSELENYEKGE